MFSKSLKTTIVAALLASSTTAPAFADNLGSAIVGGIIGGVIVNEASKNKKKRTTTYHSNSATRQQNREVQASLNYFGFPAGTPDGVLGSRSRSAISQYQAHMGFPATGQLAQYERDFLVSSYNRAQLGGPQVIKAMQGPQGVRGLLRTWRDEAAGTRSAGGYGYGGLPVEVSQAIDEIASSTEPTAEQLMQRSGFLQLADLNNDGKNDYILDTSVSGSSFWCGASHCTAMVFASSPQGYRRIDFQARGVTPASFRCHQSDCSLVEQGATMAAAPNPVPLPVPQPSAPQTTMASTQPAAPLGGIQPFAMAGDNPPTASLASHCSKVSLLTNSNGGFVTLASLRDPDLALSEQFCLARTYAIG
ncbi:peptidoglycan-binding domain-containing protein, partial [Thalassovita aquimarina]